MKFSIRQILASTAGAVIAAVVASVFGVKGTIVGVAIGSAAATFGTALVAQSIERGHEAVKQVVVRAPDSSPLLRRLGATGSGGGASTSVDDSAPTEVTAASGASAGTAPMAPAASAAENLEVTAATGAPTSERINATTRAGAAGCPAALHVVRHRRDRGRGVLPRPSAHHRHRADLGQAPGGDLRQRGQRNDGAQRVHAVTGTGARDDHHHVDDRFVDDDHDQHHDDQHHDDQHDDGHLDHHDVSGRHDHDLEARWFGLDVDLDDDEPAVAVSGRLTSP